MRSSPSSLSLVGGLHGRDQGPHSSLYPAFEQSVGQEDQREQLADGRAISLGPNKLSNGAIRITDGESSAA